jgi:hypothetical protein
VRTQEALDVLSSDAVQRDLVCRGVRRFALTGPVGHAHPVRTPNTRPATDTPAAPAAPRPAGGSEPGADDHPPQLDSIDEIVEVQGGASMMSMTRGEYEIWVAGHAQRRAARAGRSASGEPNQGEADQAPAAGAAAVSEPRYAPWTPITPPNVDDWHIRVWVEGQSVPAYERTVAVRQGAGR